MDKQNSSKKKIEKYILEYEKIFERSSYIQLNKNLVSTSEYNFKDLKNQLYKESNYLIKIFSILDEDVIIELLAILSFFPEEIRFNDAIVKIFILYHFKNSNIHAIIQIYQDILYEIENNLRENFSPFLSFIEDFIFRIPFKVFVTQFLMGSKKYASINNILQDSVFFYRNYINTTLDFNGIRAILNSQFFLSRIFQISISNVKTLNDIQVISKIPNFLIILNLNYEKIGLTLIYIQIYLSKNLLNIMKFVNQFLKPIGIFGFFNINHSRIITFYAIRNKESITHYLNVLTNSGYLESFQVFKYISIRRLVQFDSKLNGKTYFSNIFPFKSKIFVSKPSYKKNSQTVNCIRNYEEIAKYSDVSANSENKMIDSLFLYLFFNSQDFFLNLRNFSSKNEFYKHIQNSMENSIYSEILRDFSSIEQFKNIFLNLKKEKLFESFLSDGKSHNNSKLERFHKLIKNMRINDANYLQNSSFDESVGNLYYEIKNHFNKKRSNIDKKITYLVQNNYFEESKIQTIASLIQSDKSVIPLTIKSRLAVSWIQDICFYYANIKIQDEILKSNAFFIQNLFSSVNYNNLFLKWILQEKIHSININYTRIVKNWDDQQLLHYDFANQSWKSHEFEFQQMENKAIKNRDKFVRLKEENQSFKLRTNIKSKIFDYRKFSKDLQEFSYFNKIQAKLLSKIDIFNSEISKIFLEKHISPERFFSNLDMNNDFKNEIRSSFHEMDIDPSISKESRFLIILDQLNSDLNPFLFLDDPLLQGLFSLGLVNGYYFGGKDDSILILEYNFINDMILEEKSEWNRFLRAINRKYPTLKINFLQIKGEDRFLNKKVFHPDNWRDEFYLNLEKSKDSKDIEKDLLRISYNYEVCPLSDGQMESLQQFQNSQQLLDENFMDLVQNNILYYPHFFNWKFWQIAGYAFTLFLFVKNPENKEDAIRNILFQLPTGQIYHLENYKKKEERILCAFIQLKDNIPSLMQKLSEIFDRMKLDYYLFPLLSLEIYHDSVFPELFQISRTQKFHLNSLKKALKVPIFKPKMKQVTYSPIEQIEIFKKLIQDMK